MVDFLSLSEVFAAFKIYEYEKKEKFMREHSEKNKKHFVLLLLSAPKQNIRICRFL